MPKNTEDELSSFIRTFSNSMLQTAYSMRGHAGNLTDGTKKK